jgi:hypothetical protein
MEQRQFTIIIKGETAIRKLDSLGRKKGEYITRLIEADIKFEELEKRVKELEKK